MSNNIKVYNWGILAPGKIAHKFAEGLKLTNNGRLYAVASRNSDRASEFASKYNAEKAYGSYQELMLDKKVDIIYIASPHHLHFEHTRDCLMAEKAVLCEKPSSINSRQYKSLITLAGEKKSIYDGCIMDKISPSYYKSK
jgi:predicted dehydrogenase